MLIESKFHISGISPLNIKEDRQKSKCLQRSILKALRAAHISPVFSREKLKGRVATKIREQILFESKWPPKCTLSRIHFLCFSSGWKAKSIHTFLVFSAKSESREERCKCILKRFQGELGLPSWIKEKVGRMFQGFQTEMEYKQFTFWSWKFLHQVTPWIWLLLAL